MNVLSLNWFYVVLETEAQLKDCSDRNEYSDLEEELEELSKKKGSFSSVSLLHLNCQHYNFLFCFIVISCCYIDPTPEREPARHPMLLKKDFHLRARVTGVSFFNEHVPKKMVKSKEYLGDRRLGIHDRPYSRVCQAKPCWYKHCFPKKTKETPAYCQACDVYMHELCFVPYHAKFESCPWSFNEVEDVDDC